MKNNKTKDIIESVLPATRNGAKTARQNKAKTKRTARRSVKRNIGLIRCADDYIESPADLEFYPNRDINYIRNRRRDYDNLGALLRWAKYRIDHDLKSLSDDDRYFWFKNVLPDSLQGRHALGHIESALLEPSWDNFRSFRFGRYTPPKMTTRDDIVAALAKALVECKHKELNVALKKAQPYPPRYRRIKSSSIYAGYEPNPDYDAHEIRTLLGWHDIEDFADWVMAKKGYFTKNEWLKIINQAID